LRVVERSICLGDWKSINFAHVPAVAHNKLKKSFQKHQATRYTQYLQDVKEGKKEIKTAGIQPHELVKQYQEKEEELNETIEAQWRTLIKKLGEAGSLGRALAVADVSGSMSGVPMQVSISLSIVLASLANEPFKNKVITFSAVPELFNINGETLKDKISSVANMQWNMNTNFEAVFKLLINTAKMYNVKKEDMVDTVFVFTDMQFDQASGENQKTLYGTIKDMYEKEGYKIPKLVFWNLRASKDAFPIQSNTEGVALVSGFSSELLKLFMDGEDFTPETILKKALSKYNVSIHKLDL